MDRLKMLMGLAQAGDVPARDLTNRELREAVLTEAQKVMDAINSRDLASASFNFGLLISSVLKALNRLPPDE